MGGLLQALPLREHRIIITLGLIDLLLGKTDRL
jgi:hypothetical protein